MPLVEFTAPTARDPDNKAASSSRLVNCYLEPVGGRSPSVLKSVLGMSAFSELNNVFMRAMIEVKNVMYSACGGSLYKVTTDGAATLLGAIDDSRETAISSNNDKITVVANGRYFVWNGTTVSEPTAGAFDSFGHVTFMGQRTVLLEKAGRKVQWSAVADPTDLDALDFATTESRDDNNLMAFPIQGLLWIMKERSIELWQPVTDGFQFLPGSTIDTGLKAYGLACAIPNGVFFVGSDGRAYLASGGGIQPVSGVGVESTIKQSSASHVYFYADEGHQICVIRFRDRPALCYDTATGYWHERTEGWEMSKAWSAVSAVEAFGNYYVGTETGKIYRLERSNVDATGPLVRDAIGRTLVTDEHIRLGKVEMFGRVGWSNLGEEEATVLDAGDGFALDAGDGGALIVEELTPDPRPARVELRISKDYGMTWTAPKTRSLGSKGDFDIRVTWRAQGRYRSPVFRLTVSDQAEIPIDNILKVDVA